MDSEKIREYAVEHGADLIGLASIDRFENLPAEENPL